MDKEIFIISHILCGTGILFSISLKVPKVYRALTTEPTLVSELSTEIIITKMMANVFFLLFDGTLLYMKYNYGEMKKSSSETNLLDLVDGSEV